MNIAKGVALALSIVVLAGCTEARRAKGGATFSDKPADITCWSHGVQIFSGRSTGKVSHREGVGFVDATNGRYTTIQGDCRIVYDK